MEAKYICEYVQRYVCDPRPNGAIMLDGIWGSGKSYFIDNTLKKCINPKKIVVISLYGITTLDEVSKQIYMLVRFQNVFKDNEFSNTTIVATKALFSSVPIFKSIANDRNLKKLYKSIKLNETLLILEDIERSNIDIIEILGYVNNLVEYNKAHVLLVCNEKELLDNDSVIDVRNEIEKKDDSFADLFTVNNKNTKKQNINDKYSEKTKKYIRTKEKTIYDTLKFDGDYMLAINSMISQSDISYKETLLANKMISFIARSTKENGNLRVITYAIKKTEHLLSRIGKKNEDYTSLIFCSILMYKCKIMYSTVPEWNKSDEKSYDFANKEFPMFKIIYDFLHKHYLSDDSINKLCNQMDNHISEIQYAMEKESLNTLYEYYLKDEPTLYNCLKTIEKELIKDELNHGQYGKLAFHVVKVGEIIGYDLTIIKDNLLKNLQKNSKINEYSDLFFVDRFEYNHPLSEQYIGLKELMLIEIQKSRNSNNIWVNFDYRCDSVDDLNHRIQELKNASMSSGKFLSDMNHDKLIRMIEKCNSKQIDKLRGLIMDVYSDGYISHFTKDMDELVLLQENIERLLKDESLDAIKRLQYQYFSKNLEDIIMRINKLKGGA